MHAPDIFEDYTGGQGGWSTMGIWERSRRHPQIGKRRVVTTKDLLNHRVDFNSYSKVGSHCQALNREMT